MSVQETSVSSVLYDCMYSKRSSSASSSCNCSESTSSTNQRRTTKRKQRPDYKRRVKPPYSYVEMISMALRSSDSGKMTLRDITNFMYDRFQCFRGDYVGWKNSVRHNLSASECFTKVLRDTSRPFGKDNFWTMNENCEHCKESMESAAARRRIMPISKLYVNDNWCSENSNMNINRNLPINLVIPAMQDSPSSTTSDNDVFESDDVNQTAQPYYPATNWYNTYQRSPQSADVPTEIYGYDQHHYAAYHSHTRHHHRYHPYSTPHSASCQPSLRGPACVDDVTALDDLYVPVTDVDLAMYSDAIGKLHTLQPLTKEQPHGLYAMLYPNIPWAYDINNYPFYAHPELPTPNEYSPEHYEMSPPSDTMKETRPSCNKTPPPVNMNADSYVYPHQSDYVTTTSQEDSFPSSPSSVSSSLSSVSSDCSESDIDLTPYAPTEALAVIYN